MINRRRLLTVGGLTAGGVVGGVLLLPPGPKAASGPGTAEHAVHIPGLTPVAGTRTASPTVTPFSRRMPVPAELTPRRRDGVDVYQIPIKAAETEILAGHPAAVRTYGGSFIGPTIRAKTGTPVRVTFANQLDVPANVHLHGGHVPQNSDGHPMDTIAPGQSRNYDYPNSQQGATLWYHDHSHHLEAENCYKGLHGFYIIDDPAEAGLGLPTGEFDVPIMLRDVQLDANGALVWPSIPPDRTTILANGVITPNFPVAARKYRFRLLNAGNESILRLKLGGLQMTQIASDGGLLSAPVTRTEIVLGSAERVDIVVDFSQQPIGSKFVLQDATGPVLRFDVTRTAVDRSRVPARLRALPALRTATVERDVTMRFDLSGPEPIGLVNERPYDPDRIDFRIKRGTTEIWRITNTDTEFGIPHTFHMHLEQFRVLDRDGAPPGLDDAGRKDTVFVNAGETVRVQVTFTEFLGKYAFHCHFTDHSAIGMMAQMEIVA